MPPERESERASRLVAWPLEALARCLPADFRSRHGVDVVECHLDWWRDRSRGRGKVGALVLYGRTLWSMSWAVLRAWRAAGRSTMKGSNREVEMGMERWVQEVVYGTRRLLRSPGFSAVVVLTLGLGVGANTAVFAVLHGVLVAPLPYEESDRLVRVYGNRIDRPGEFERLDLAGPQALELVDGARSLGPVAILETSAGLGADLSGVDGPERIRVLRVNGEYFDALGARPILGRTFEPSEEVAGAPVALVREAVWQRHLSGDAEAVGGTIALDGTSVTVVGVVSDGLRDPIVGPVDVWLPADLRGAQADYWENNYLSAFARLAPSTDIETLRAELAVFAERHADISSAAAEKGFAVISLHDDIVGESRPLLLAIMGAVLFLLALTCVNVASLFFARAASRERELAIRTSLGSPRSSLVRHFVVEALLLSLAGGLAGLGVGVGGLELITSIAPEGLPRREAIGLGAAAVWFAAGSSVVIGLVLGVATALPFTRGSADAVGAGTRSRGESLGSARLRAMLVRVEVALAIVLLTGAGVLVQTVRNLQGRDLGADLDSVLTFQVGLPQARYPTDEALYRFNRTFHEAVAAIPGVRSVAATSRLPVTGSYNTWGSRRAHAPDAPFDTDNISVNQRWVAGDYFETAGLTLVQGRLFTAEDAEDVPYATVVNQTLVRRLFEAENPIGQMLFIGGRYTTVVGVVEDEALTARRLPAPMAFHHQRQWISGNRQMTQMIKVDGDASTILPAVRGALAGVDPQLVLYAPAMLEDVVGAGMAQERFAAHILGAFAALAALVAGLGLYGVLAHFVGRRRHEIGVRLALGAHGAGVVRMILARGVGLTATGALVGVGLWLAVGGTLEGLVYEVSPRDPLVLLAAPVLLLIVSVVASGLPAARATRVDPVTAFRAE